ncbi:SapC family protein [Shewanella psychropiezotolerans]|uniref:SapC family protein n=1 Tax=Shewanella psychropiezotolerans TaxID=2593655 RepID=A0ABX5X1Z7_9GAMM|nr:MULTISPECIES: SapC family protein [Shewanella]MPY21001.1 SapC family protein [Shewanella sp. YLB-07]MPY21788.1 SapC family protein [Shewanella sp. YLB-07]QDO85319.1 SapC family protein [Shewanella psychropiezotolerans]
MPNEITLLEPNKHSDVKVSKPNYSQVANQHILPITLHEFSRAATEYPIVFVKNSETGQFQPVVMLGLQPEQNLSVVNGEWIGSYIPNIVKDYPFAVVLNAEQPEKIWIGIKEQSAQVGTEVGEPLFNAGEETPFFTKRREEIVQHFEQEQATQAILQLIAEKGLFRQQSLTVNIKGDQRNINGLYMIDEAKLNDLNDDDFLDLKKRGLLGPIYGHLTSLHQVNRLARTEVSKG